MDTPNFEDLTKDQLYNFLHLAKPDQIASSIEKMTREQIMLTMEGIDKGRDPAWKEKTRAAILGLNERKQLEILASKLSKHQVFELINKTLQVEDKHHWKLSPLLKGISFDVFSELLNDASENELQILQHEGVTEPVQHKLTTLSHEYSIQMEKIEREIDSFDQEIEQLKIEELSRIDVLEILYKIGLYSEFFETRFQNAKKALAIAWNTNRVDLIVVFNKIKDSCQKYNLYGIGFPSKEGAPATGLFGKLEKHLFSIYGDPNDPNDPNATHDDEPAIEGLVKFSIWYLRDYFEMGLLPSVKDPKDLDFDLSKHSEIERTRFREELFLEAKKNLEQIGLATIADLKKAYIFSRKTLEDYIHEKIKS